jgi:hypothetical protein
VHAILETLLLLWSAAQKERRLDPRVRNLKASRRWLASLTISLAVAELAAPLPEKALTRDPQSPAGSARIASYNPTVSTSSGVAACIRGSA